MDNNQSSATAIVLAALVQDETEPGHLQKVERNAEILFRILGDCEDITRERLDDCMVTLQITGELCRKIEESKLEGRFSGYP